MQKTIVDLAFLCFFVFLFGALSQWRRDVRLRYWAAGWFFLVPHFAIEL